MKSVLSLLTVVCVIGMQGILYAQEFASTKASNSISRSILIENNYLEGLNSEAIGIKIRCAYFLGEMKSKRAVEPLMDMFNNEENYSARLISAWSLLKIGDQRGVSLIKKYFESGENSEISCMLDCMYIDYCLKNKGRVNH